MTEGCANHKEIGDAAPRQRVGDPWDADRFTVILNHDARSMRIGGNA
jgi:hypothetical protein